MDFGIKFWDGDAHVYVCPLERGSCVVSEARPAALDCWKLEILNAAVKFMEANWP